MSEVSMEKDNSFWRTGNPVSFSFKMLWCQICLLLGILSLTAVSFFKPFSVSGTECGLSGRFQDNYYKGVSFSTGEQGLSQRLVTPWKSFSPTFPSFCLFWSPELGFPSPTQSVPICVQVSLPTSVEFCPQPFQMRLTWKNSTCHLAETCDVLLITSTISSTHEASALNPQAWLLPILGPSLQDLTSTVVSTPHAFLTNSSSPDITWIRILL